MLPSNNLFYTSINSLYIVYYDHFTIIVQENQTKSRNMSTFVILYLDWTWMSFFMSCRRADTGARSLFIHRHQYAGALPITVETYFLTFELLLPAGQARRPVAPRNELRKWREMLGGRHSQACATFRKCWVPLQKGYVAAACAPAFASQLPDWNSYSELHPYFLTVS